MDGARIQQLIDAAAQARQRLTAGDSLGAYQVLTEHRHR